MPVNLLFVASPRPNEVVGINEPFIISGSAPINNLDEVTVQIDNVPHRPVIVTLIPHSNRVMFNTWGTVTVAGPHTVTVTAVYAPHGANETQTVAIEAQGEIEATATEAQGEIEATVTEAQGEIEATAKAATA